MSVATLVGLRAILVLVLVLFLGAGLLIVLDSGLHLHAAGCLIVSGALSAIWSGGMIASVRSVIPNVGFRGIEDMKPSTLRISGVGIVILGLAIGQASLR